MRIRYYDDEAQERAVRMLQERRSEAPEARSRSERRCGASVTSRASLPTRCEVRSTGPRSTPASRQG